MFQAIKKLTQSNNEVIRDRALKLMSRYAFAPIAVNNNHYLFPISPISLLDLSDRTIESASDLVYEYAINFLRLRPSQFDIVFQGTNFALYID